MRAEGRFVFNKPLSQVQVFVVVCKVSRCELCGDSSTFDFKVDKGSGLSYLEYASNSSMVDAIDSVLELRKLMELLLSEWPDLGLYGCIDFSPDIDEKYGGRFSVKVNESGDDFILSGLINRWCNTCNKVDHIAFSDAGKLVKFRCSGCSKDIRWVNDSTAQFMG